MIVDSLSSCCGIGEFSSLKESSVYCDYWNPTIAQIEAQRKEGACLSGENINGLVKLIKKKRDAGGKRNWYNVVIATTPDKDDWWMFHIALPMAGFIPICACPSHHDKGRYNNILWVFERNPSD